MYPYKRTFWQDHVVDQQTQEVIQQGTPQSATNFNNQEEGIFSAGELSAVLAQQVRQHDRSLADLEGEIQTVALTNSQAYPFNNSLKTVSLAKKRDTLNYRVITEVQSVTAGHVGDIAISDKALNGFKISYSGSATAVTLIVWIEGGMSQ